jgi:hypothetical protein
LIIKYFALIRLMTLVGMYMKIGGNGNFVTAPYVESCLLGNVSEIPTSLDQL